MVTMIIKGLFRRYERWNPVHPTSGAFWGMGIGLGCGVGWGPGFGPEVIGYVGAGCGLGFSVGITLAGVGIGLPANYVFRVPLRAILATRNGALAFVRSNDSPSEKNVVTDGWMTFAPTISNLHRETIERIFSFKREAFVKSEGLFDLKGKLSEHSRSFTEVLETVRSRFPCSNKGQG